MFWQCCMTSIGLKHFESVFNGFASLVETFLPKKKIKVIGKGRLRFLRGHSCKRVKMAWNNLQPPFIRIKRSPFYCHFKNSIQNWENNNEQKSLLFLGIHMLCTSHTFIFSASIYLNVISISCFLIILPFILSRYLFTRYVFDQ